MTIQRLSSTLQLHVFVNANISVCVCVCSSTNRNHTTYAYRLLGTWGYAPHPQRWTEFRDWYVSKQLYNANITANNTRLNETGFKPYVPGIVMTAWFQTVRAAESTGQHVVNMADTSRESTEDLHYLQQPE
jgi:hypothetical protein